MQLVRDKITKVVLRQSDTPFSIDGKIPAGLDPSLEVVQVTDPPAQPAFNPATQKIVPTSSEQAPIGPGFPIRLVSDWQVVSLTQAEIDAKAALAADEQERQQLKTLVAELKTPGAKTTVQRLATCERALAKIIPDIYR